MEQVRWSLGWFGCNRSSSERGKERERDTINSRHRHQRWWWQLTAREVDPRVMVMMLQWEQRKGERDKAGTSTTSGGNHWWWWWWTEVVSFRSGHSNQTSPICKMGSSIVLDLKNGSPILSVGGCWVSIGFGFFGFEVWSGLDLDGLQWCFPLFSWQPNRG